MTSLPEGSSTDCLMLGGSKYLGLTHEPWLELEAAALTKSGKFPYVVHEFNDGTITRKEGASSYSSAYGVRVFVGPHHALLQGHERTITRRGDGTTCYRRLAAGRIYKTQLSVCSLGHHHDIQWRVWRVNVVHQNGDDAITQVPILSFGVSQRPRPSTSVWLSTQARRWE